MQTFGKREYGHMDVDPWAKKTAQRVATPRKRSIPVSKIAGYLFALATFGVIAVAGFEMLVMA